MLDMVVLNWAVAIVCILGSIFIILTAKKDEIGVMEIMVGIIIAAIGVGILVAVVTENEQLLKVMYIIPIVGTLVLLATGSRC